MTCRQSNLDTKLGYIKNLFKIGYFSNFKGRKTLLLAGSGNEVNLLLQFFLGWGEEKVELLSHLRLMDVMILTTDLEALFIDSSPEDKEVSIYSDEASRKWTISSSGRLRIIELLQALKDSIYPAHQFLEFSPDDKELKVQILCSKDEYET